MSKHCTSCGKPIAEDDTFCGSCGAKQGVFVEQAKSGGPHGKDWIAVAFAGLLALEVLAYACKISYILGILLLFLGFRQRNNIRQAIWKPNVFLPLMVHSIWGLTALFGFFVLWNSRQMGIGDGVALLIYKGELFWALIISAVCFVVFLGIYFLGNWIICKVYPKSKPQGWYIRFLVTCGLIIMFASFKSNDDKSVDFSGDTAGVVAGASASDAVTSVQTDMSVADVGATTDSNIVDTAGITPVIDNTSGSGDTTVSFTDSLSQPDGSAIVHNDGTVDFVDANMQYAGHITDGGQLLNSLNLSDGHIDGNTIFDAQNQVAYTIEGNTIYDNLHQAAYTVRDGSIYDIKNQLVGKMS